MAHLEVWKGKKLITRREVDEQQATKGLRVRLGSKGRTHIRVGESRTIGSYRVELIADRQDAPAAGKGPGPDDSAPIEAMSQLEFSEAEQAGTTPAAQAVPEIEGYVILNELGRGGMGIVWRAVQLSTKRHVALKLLGIRSFVSDKSRARFSREVALAARLTHPNIARVYDSGLTSGIYYYAMELVEGMRLDRYVHEMGLNHERVLMLMKKVCQAMAFAHSKGVVHRDLKPSNILVTSDGEPHILDFGLAKARERGTGELTVSIEGEIAGTPGYMSPEQAAGKTDAIDERSDVYSIGVILYQLLTAKMPQDPSGSPYEMMKRRVEEEVIPPHEAVPSINRDLEHLLLKALTREPADRYRSMSDLAEDIEHYLAGEPLSAQGASISQFFRKHMRQHPEYTKTVISIFFFGLALLVIGHFFARWLNAWVDNNIPATVYVSGPPQEMEKEARASFDRLERAVRTANRSAVTKELQVLDGQFKYTSFFKTHRQEIEAARKWVSSNPKPMVPGQFNNMMPQDYRLPSRSRTRQVPPSRGTR